MAGDVWGELGGEYQKKNTATVLTAIEILRKEGFAITDEAIKEGFAHVTSLTGLQGRWQIVSTSPTVICDTGPNTGGMQYIAQQLNATPHKQLRIVIVMVNDKDISGVISMLPTDAIYYFTQASVARAMKAEEIARIGAEHGLKGTTYASVAEAYHAARAASDSHDVVFVGGSTLGVADCVREGNGK